MHNKGFFHGDLNTSHILIGIGGEDNPEFYFVDFENSRLGRKVTPAQRIKELARLNESMPGFITRKDKLRFFKAYRKGNKLLERKKKGILGKITRRTLEKAHHLTTL